MSDGRENGPVALYGSELLNAWIEAGGVPERPVKLRNLKHRWFGFWSKHYMKITSQKCADSRLPTDPVFIVGLWRTGSTVLHSALCDESPWSTPRTWQCFHPSEFLLLPPPKRRQVVRPMDAGTIDTFSPQEDEFASLLLGESTTYRAFIDPRRIGELASLLDEWRTCGTARSAPLSLNWETFLRAVLTASPGRLLIKSPNHTFRLPWLIKRFPEARFIWLNRSRDQVLQSNKRMWTAMTERYGQWRLQPPALDAFLGRALDNHDEIFDWASRAIPERLLVADFDEILHRRPTLVARIRGFLGAHTSHLHDRI